MGGGCRQGWNACSLLCTALMEARTLPAGLLTSHLGTAAPLSDTAGSRLARLMAPDDTVAVTELHAAGSAPHLHCGAKEVIAAV